MRFYKVTAVLTDGEMARPFGKDAFLRGPPVTESARMHLQPTFLFWALIDSLIMHQQPTDILGPTGVLRALRVLRFPCILRPWAAAALLPQLRQP